MREASWLESDLQFCTCPRKTRSTYGRNALGKYPQLASRQICLKSFDAEEMDLLESSLRRIASGMENAGIVLNTTRQIIAQS
jgi:hypothetical protein